MALDPHSRISVTASVSWSSHFRLGMTSRDVPDPSGNVSRPRSCVFPISSARCLGESGFALLSQGRKTLQNVTASPSEIGLITRTALVLTLFEHKRLT
jgi:hypothetical protein